MKILLIIPNLDFGGAQVSFSKLSEYLGVHHHVSNVIFNKHEMIALPFGGDLIDLDVPASGNLLAKVSNFFRRIRRLRRIKEKVDPDISISFLEGADYVNILSRRREKIIISIRGSKKYDQNIRGWLGLVRHWVLIPFLYNKADKIIALNYGIKHELINRYRIRTEIDVIYNGFDTSLIQSRCQESIADTEIDIFSKPVLISHGRLSYEKGFDILIQLFAKYPGLQSYRLLLIGHGDFKETLIRQCTGLGIEFWDEASGRKFNPLSIVCFLAYRQNPFKYISRSKLFVLPSRHEGFGNSLAEAMACGIPVIASDCPYGPREILSPGRSPEYGPLAFELADYGVLIKANLKADEHIDDAWNSCIITLMKDELVYTRYVKAGLERIRNFDLSLIQNKWLYAINAFK